MKRLTLLSLLCLMLFTSCEHKDLCYDHHHFVHYVRVYINEQIPNVTMGFYNSEYTRPHYAQPVVMRLVLADPITGRTVTERFLRNKGQDARGTYFDGYINADPGKYKLLAYNFDTETTLVAGEGLWGTSIAYTNEIVAHLYSRIYSRANAATKDDGTRERIVYEPDHFFVTDFGEIDIPIQEPNQPADTLYTPDGDHFIANSLVKSYFLQVNVEGLEYASSSLGLLTGMSGSSWIASRTMKLDDDVTVYFELHPGKNGSAAGMKRGKNQSAILYTTFSTFGKLPEEINNLEMTFDFMTTYGKPYSETIDITPVFSTPEAREKQWLLLDHTIRIPEPPPSEGGGGGFSPGVGEWKDVETDIII